LLDRLPLEQIPEAERALREAAAALPGALRERLGSDQQLGDEDRAAIIASAAQALERFQPATAAATAAATPAATPAATAASTPAVGADVQAGKR
jgi:F-type H+-transporting ATPase subunit alpha